MLVVLFTIETIGFNLLSYCCGDSEISLFISGDVSCKCQKLHNHYSENCCCSNHSCKDKNEEQLTLGDVIHGHKHDESCVNNNFIQFRPVKDNDCFINIQVFLPVVTLLFDFNPEINNISTHLYIERDTPLPLTGRDVLSKNSTFLI